MIQLKNFEQTNNELQILADLKLDSKNLYAEFVIDDQESTIDYRSDPIRSTSPARSHELWKFTCFEVFWARPQESSYWELNFNFKGQWNLYHFNSYRQPSPPEENFGFEFVRFEFKNSKLSFRLRPLIRIEEYEISLASIVKFKSHKTEYFATEHCGDKPDFHLRESFQIKRNLNQ
jgi:hypothetical protein